MNPKLGGVNGTTVDMADGKSVLSHTPTMVMGVDVNHAPPGAGSEANSYAAIVATLDKHGARFHTEARAHETEAAPST